MPSKKETCPWWDSNLGLRDLKSEVLCFLTLTLPQRKDWTYKSTSTVDIIVRHWRSSLDSCWNKERQCRKINKHNKNKTENEKKFYTIIILSIWTDRSEQTVLIQIRLLLQESLICVYTLFHSVCIFCRHFSTVKLHSCKCLNSSDIYHNNFKQNRNRNIKWQHQTSRSMIKPTKSSEPRHDKTNKVSVRPAKTQISLGIWSESLLCALWVAKSPSFLHAETLISGCRGWSVFAGSTRHFVGFVEQQLNYK